MSPRDVAAPREAIRIPANFGIRSNRSRLTISSLGFGAMSEGYEEAAKRRRYTLKCHYKIARRRVERVIARGLTWAAVNELAERMQAREKARVPYWSSWTGRLFIPELER